MSSSSSTASSVAKVFGSLKPYKRTREERAKTPKATYSLVSRPDNDANLPAAAYFVPDDKYDEVFAGILQTTFQNGVSFTFSERVESTKSPLIFDLDLHLDPAKTEIVSRAYVEDLFRQHAAEKNWSDRMLETELKKQLDELDASRRAKRRVLGEEAISSFMNLVAMVIALMTDPAKVKTASSPPLTLDYHVRQRAEPKYTDFDNGTKDYYDDGAHIQVNLQCTVEQRIIIRHCLLESFEFSAWYAEHICPFLHTPSYATRASSPHGQPEVDDEYAVAKLVDYSVTAGCAPFSVIGSHKKGYKPYILSQFGRIDLWRAAEAASNSSPATVEAKVAKEYSFEDAAVIRDDMKLEAARRLAHPVKGCMTLNELVAKYPWVFSARSKNRRAYTPLIGSVWYRTMKEDMFDQWYVKKRNFYVPVLPRNQLVVLKAPEPSSSTTQEEEMAGGEQGEDDIEDTNYRELVKAMGGRTNNHMALSQEEEEEEEEEIIPMDEEEEEYSAPNARKKRRVEEELELPAAKKTRKQQPQTGSSTSFRESVGAGDQKKKKKQSRDDKLTESLEAAREAAVQGKEHDGVFDYRKFQDVARTNVLLVTEEDIMRCTNMDELDALYDQFVESISSENPISPGANDDLQQATMLAMALPEDYYRQGSRDYRIRVCWALRNTSEYLLIVWIRFVCQRGGDCFTRMAEWIDNWNSGRSDNTTYASSRGQVLQLGSLRHWVMHHDPAKLAEITNSIFSTKVEKMIDDIAVNVMMSATVFNNQARVKSLCVGDFQMAQLLEFLLGDRMVLCSYPNSSNVIWMKYNEATGLWKRHPSLSTELSITLNNYFKSYFKTLSKKMSDLPHSGKPANVIKKETEVLNRKMQEVLNVTTRLSMHQGKSMIINEAKTLLHRENFLSVLDSNRFLFAFTNGVLDFSVSPPVFRKIEPSDYLSVSCENPYLEYYDGTSKTLTPDELQEVHEKFDDLVYSYGLAMIQKYPDKYASIPDEETRINEAGKDALREDPARIFRALPDRLQPIASQITEYMRQMFQEVSTRSYAYKLLSLPLVGSTVKNQFAHLMTGKGKNGKSVFCTDLMKFLFGGLYYSMDVRYWVQATTKAGGVQPELVQARPARCMPSFEPPDGASLNEHTLKTFVGGTDELNCRALFEPPIRYIPQFTAMLVSNHNLRIDSYDGGVTRRIRSLYFGTYFYDDESGPLPSHSGKPIYQFKKDPSLTNRMAHWAPVFLWMLVKLYVLIDGSMPPLSEVPEVKFHTENFFNDYDVEGAFIRTFIDVDSSEGAKILKSDLNKKYKEWYMSQYAKEPSSITKLHKRLGDFVESKQDQVVDDGWLGLFLHEEPKPKHLNLTPLEETINNQDPLLAS